MCFHTFVQNFIPLIFFSYPAIFFHTFIKSFHTLIQIVSYLYNLFRTLISFFIPQETCFSYHVQCFSYLFKVFVRAHCVSYLQHCFSYAQILVTLKLHQLHCMYIYLQIIELLIFSDAPYYYVTLLSLHPPPRDGCDRHRLHPHARYQTHFHQVVKHDHVQYTCCMLELPIPGHTQVLTCAPSMGGDVTVGGLRITIVRARPPTATFSQSLSHQD
jgi:hypothetical protein